MQDLRERLGGEPPRDQVLDGKVFRSTGYITFSYGYGCCVYEFQADDGEVAFLRKEDLQQ